MREAIVNVSSGVGNVAPPFLGAYAAAQFAKEGLSDALRRELRPLGVSVSVMQPGAVYTDLGQDAPIRGRDPCCGFRRGRRDLSRPTLSNFWTRVRVRAQASKTTTADYADAVAAALAAKRPKTRYRVGVDSWGSALARRVVPDRMMDALITVGLKALTRAASSHRSTREMASS